MGHPRPGAGIVIAAALLLAAGCGGEGAEPAIGEPDAADAAEAAGDLGPTSATFVLTSPAFADGAAIPERHSCRGEDVSPALTWTDPPSGTASLALVMDDPDAVPVAGRVWDHWVLWGLSELDRSLPAAVPPDESLAGGAVQGQNSFGRTGYGGPCPPSDQTHRYVFALYALDGAIDPPGRTKADLLDAIEGHVLARATLTGTFGR